MTSTVANANKPWAGRFSRAPSHRRFAVGDVHGCVKTLRALIEEQIQPIENDCIYLLGDYIDRGPDSKGVLDYLLHLIWETDIGIVTLRGNHEQLLLDAVHDETAAKLWYGNGGWGTMHQLGATTPAEIPERYVKLCAAMRHLVVQSDYVLCHAGLNFRAADPICDTSDFDLLWMRNSLMSPGKIGGRTLIHGHSVTPIFTIQASLSSSVINLDNGCFDKGHGGYGNLVALNLDTRELLVQENGD